MARPSPPPLPLTPKPRMTPAIQSARLSPLALPTSQAGPRNHSSASRPTSKTLPPPRASDGQPIELPLRIERENSSRVGHRREHEASALALKTLNAKLVTEAQDLRINIQRLEHAQQRNKARLQQKSEQVKDERAALEETRTQLIMAEEKVEDMEKLVRVLLKDLNQFRGWWLTEYLSLRALLELVPDKADVEPLMSSAEARFKIYTTTL